jgi:phosphohistidine phosphatase
MTVFEVICRRLTEAQNPFILSRFSRCSLSTSSNLWATPLIEITANKTADLSTFHLRQLSMSEEYTTNAHDLAEAAKLQSQLDQDSDNAQPLTSQRIPSVSIDSGAYKYVLITALPPNNNGSMEIFVHSKRGAQYHRNVAEPLIPILKQSGYTCIAIKGGGRILRCDDDKIVKIFGYSYGFGAADHALAKDVVEKSGKFAGYSITWSNDGY